MAVNRLSMVDERSLQAAVFQGVHRRAELDDRWWLITAIGEEARHVRAQKLWAEGVHRGVPDLFWFLPMRGFHGMAVKLEVGSQRLTPSQRHWIDGLTVQGYCTLIVYNNPALVIAAFEWYIANSAPPYDCPLQAHLLRCGGTSR